MNLRGLGVAAAFLIAWLFTPFSHAADAPPGKKRAPLERLAPARLKAANDDVVRLQRSRRGVAALPGLHDYRAILHAHAEDSAHTGGTRPEMLADAKKAGVDAILLSNHFRPPTDFITDSWRGLHDGVLFIPGSEDRGFLLLPVQSIKSRMKDPTPLLIEAVTADGGLIFLSHIEERPDHSMAGLNGMEIYNRHADAKKDAAGIQAIVLMLTDPGSLKELAENLKLFPDLVLAAQVQYPADYLAKWDAETKMRRLTGVAANDCHHNQVLVVKMVDDATILIGTNVDRDDEMRTFTAARRPGIRAFTSGHRPGDILARLDFDPYFRSFRNASTHILAPELTEAAIRSALRDGHAYVSHDWMCDPSGFVFELTTADPTVHDPKTPAQVIMGDEVKLARGQRLAARFPLECRIRLLRDGNVIAETSGDLLAHPVGIPGVYRVEGWLEIDGESRPWIYSNPIYLRQP